MTVSLKSYLLSTVSYPVLNFRSPIGYKQITSVQRSLDQWALAFASAFNAAMHGAGHAEATKTALREVRQTYPEQDKLGLDQSAEGSRSLREALEG